MLAQCVALSRIEGPERLDRATPRPHGIRFEQHLNVVEHVLVLPARRAALLGMRAPVLEQACLAVRAALTVERYTFSEPNATLKRAVGVQSNNVLQRVVMRKKLRSVGSNEIFEKPNRRLVWRHCFRK